MRASSEKPPLSTVELITIRSEFPDTSPKTALRELSVLSLVMLTAMITETPKTIPNIVRSRPLSWVVGGVRSAHIALAERPDLVITTGAGVVVFLCIFCKLLGAKLIFLESMAKVDRPTMTARLLYRFSDLFIVQWPSLLKFFPRAKFVGRLF